MTVIGPRKTRDETGFTLIEILLVVTLMGVIVAATTTAFVVSARGQQRAAEALPGPKVSNLLSSWLTADIGSAVPVNIGTWLDTSSGVTTGCSSTPAGTTNLLRIESRDPTTPTDPVTGLPVAPTYIASYRYNALTRTITRYFCKGQVSPGPLNPPIAVSILAEEVGDLSSTPPAPAPEAVVSPAKDKVSMTLSIVHGPTPYLITVAAAVRVPQSPPAIVVVTPPPPTSLLPCAFSAGTVSPASVGRFTGGPTNKQLLLGVTVSVVTNAGPTAEPCTLLRAKANGLSCDLTTIIGVTRSGLCFGPGSPNASATWNASASPGYLVSIVDRVDPGIPAPPAAFIPPSDAPVVGPNLTLTVT
jgi:prepilin-type N-terminal cleavage/methylation domain-containing protein